MNCFLSCSLCYASEEAVDSSRVPDMLQEPGLSSLSECSSSLFSIIARHRSDASDMHVVRGSDQVQPTHTAMQAFPNLRHDRLKTAQLMQFVQRTTQRFSLEAQQCCEFFVGQQRVFQQQVQDVPVV